MFGRDCRRDRTKMKPSNGFRVQDVISTLLRRSTLDAAAVFEVMRELLIHF